MQAYVRLIVTIEPRGEARDVANDDEPLSGPRLRRVLGNALVGGFCPYGRPVCEAQPDSTRSLPREVCSLAESCPYGLLFAASHTDRPPFALYVPATSPDPTSFVEITLFGAASGLSGWVLAALARALEDGVGPRRMQFRITRIDQAREIGSQALCGGDLANLPAILEPDVLNLRAEPFEPGAPVTVELLSPTRIKHEGRLLREDTPIPFQVLLARILGRFRDLYGQWASDLLRPEINDAVLREAGNIELLTDETRWVEVHDYSARQGAELRLGGRVGELTYGRGAARFLPILRAGEVIHVGKNPTSGCGRVRVLPWELHA